MVFYKQQFNYLDQNMNYILKLQILYYYHERGMFYACLKQKKNFNSF